MNTQYILSASSRKDKKYMVKYFNDITGRLNTIHFGELGADDFTLFNNKEQKQRYIDRHSKDRVDDLRYAGAWAMNLLWNKPTISASINDMEKLFGVSIKHVRINNT